MISVGKISAREKINQISDDLGDDGLIVMNGFDDCIVGVGTRFNDIFVVYDLRKVLAKLEAEGMTPEEAVEFHQFHLSGAWVGNRTPAFVDYSFGEEAE